MKNKQFFYFLCIMVCLVLFPEVNHASIIGTIEVTQGGGCSGLYEGVEINVLFGSDDTGVGGVRLFDDFFFTPSDVGTSVTVTDADNPEFDEVVALLTNGVNDHLHFETHGYPHGCIHGNGGNEAYSFFGDSSGANGIDFEAYTITSIGLRMDALTLDFSDDRIWTDVSTTYTLFVEGEPAIVDSDGDGIPDETDNCPATPNPNQFDIDGDNIGDECDTDNDNDGYPDTIDCDPLNPEVHNGADEICNGIDDNCDYQIDEGVTNACGDCGLVPEETCNGIDDNCNGEVDETVQQIYYRDYDGDGYGYPGISVQICPPPPAGFVVDSTDCDDSDENVNPVAEEVCNNLDDNCNGEVNEGFPDLDADGQADCIDADDDNDDIADEYDLCPNTVLPTVVDATGCSIDQLCPCEEDWRSHGQYKSCVDKTAKKFAKSRLITNKEKAVLVRQADWSDCGR
jgi:hypothetical protein